MTAHHQLMNDLAGKHLVLGLTGGIAAYKSAELARRLQDHGATVQVVMTDAATHFITPVTLQALTGRVVFTDQWDARQPNNMAHIDLSREADAIVVVPASADFIAKLAHGICDDLLTTVCVARECPLLIAPAMNRQMWANPATQRNAQQVAADGVVVLGPASGDQACGEVGDGRMLEPHDILEDLIAFFQPKVLAGKRVLVTAGPTREAIDPVRAITNHSSGKMGYAVARAAREAGAVVTLVSGPTSLTTPRGVTRIDIENAREMHAAVMQRASKADCFIAVAAVADWHVVNVADQKIKKSAEEATAPTLEFAANPDILASVAALPDAPFCVGFAAETIDLDANAEAKLARKRVQLIVGNHAHEAFGRDENALTLYDAGGRTILERADKLTLARRLIAAIAERMGHEVTGDGRSMSR
ncbi:MAG: bifunctional phosphopantothenoylcysteine decarboxylase/phosphopantothenate--cysteine ligase CoaBC [Gemmatimonadota bacterium]|nr:bifunctional phosphopantothenoylcysteine decarboxylase/phosphopantothenate--cysteine ligase CoaBC [Gemmatimonadota bacterium]